MHVVARVKNEAGKHVVRIATENAEKSLQIAAKANGGSSVNGGELLCLALATCYCNDLYREAATRRVDLAAVEVEVEAEFGGPGEPARSVQYRAKLLGRADAESLRQLALATDAVAEIHGTLRRGVAVQLAGVEVASQDPAAR